MGGLRRACNIIISSVTSWSAGRQQTAGSTSHRDANGMMTQEKKVIKRGKDGYENEGGPTEELKQEKDRKKA